jgi:hypothetical protein
MQHAPVVSDFFADELVFVASYIQMFGASVIQSPFGLIQHNMSA